MKQTTKSAVSSESPKSHRSHHLSPAFHLATLIFQAGWSPPHDSTQADGKRTPGSNWMPGFQKRCRKPPEHMRMQSHLHLWSLELKLLLVQSQRSWLSRNTLMHEEIPWQRPPPSLCRSSEWNPFAHLKVPRLQNAKKWLEYFLALFYIQETTSCRSHVTPCSSLWFSFS